MVRAFLAAATSCALAASGCSKPPPDPLQLEGNRLTVFNNTGSDWTDVEIWVNRQFRVTVPRIQDGAPFIAPLDVFVAGFGQRFDAKRMPIRDLRLKAKDARGEAFELQKEFIPGGLEGALRGFRRK